MFCRGILVWSGADNAAGEVWDGYTVFQVKHKERLETPQRNAAWLWSQVRRELEEWSTNTNRGDIPNHLVIISNVPLTPTPGTGGLDIVSNNIENFIRTSDESARDIDKAAKLRREKRRSRLARLRKWRIWDGNQVDALVSCRHAGVRRAFKAFLTPDDVFAHLSEFTDKIPISDLEPGLRRHARTSLTGERSLYFDEAGAADGTGTPIEQVAIDLPIASGDGGKRQTVFGYVLDRGERVLNPRLNLHTGPRHLIVAGGPGNGKTTISKFLVQVYRAALLRGSEDLAADHITIIEETAQTLVGMGHKGLPKHRRWPMRIDLAEYAEEHGLSSDSTLVRWIALKVSARSNVGSVTPNALNSWMTLWPWFLCPRWARRGY